MLLIVSLYMDGEVRTIEGYVEDEETAKQKVKKLNCTVAKGEGYSYSYQFVEKFVTVRFEKEMNNY